MANLRTSNYKGFNYASGSADGAGGGVFLYSGSMVLDPAGTFTSYSGVGMELVGHSESYLRFQSSTSLSPGLLDVRTDSFYVGNPNTQFISGSGGSVEISSSNFHLTPTGDLTASNATFDGYAVARALRQTTLTINSDNSDKYIKHQTMGGGVEVIDIFLDGSAGGDQTSHVIIDLDCITNEDDLTAEGTSVEDKDGDDRDCGAIRNITPMSALGSSQIPFTIEVASNRDVQLYVDTDTPASFGASSDASNKAYDDTPWLSTEEF